MSPYPSCETGRRDAGRLPESSTQAGGRNCSDRLRVARSILYGSAGCPRRAGLLSDRPAAGSTESGPGLRVTSALRTLGPQNDPPVQKVLHESTLPDWSPRRSHSTRCSDDPWVNDSGTTVPCDWRCSRSSPMAAAALSPSSASPGLEQSLLRGVVSPHAGVAVGLQFLPHRERIGFAFTGTLPGRLHSSRHACQRLHVMTDFVRDHVGLCEVSGRTESFVEIPEEGEVEIDLAVGRTVEGTHRGLTEAACRSRGVGEEDEHWRLVRCAALRRKSRPHVISVSVRTTATNSAWGSSAGAATGSDGSRVRSRPC